MRKHRIFAALLLLAVASAPAFALEQATFDSDGVPIKYVMEGQGEPVVLIHGFIANAQLNWIAPGVFGALAKDHQVIALDLRGHGQSGKPHDPAAYGPQMAKDVINLLDHLKIQKAHIVGYSLGGFITVHIAAKYPDRVISAIPSGAGWTPPGDVREGLSEEIAKALESGNGITPLIVALTPSGRPAPTPEQLASMNKMVTGMNDTQALAAVARGMKNLSVPEKDIAAIKVPVRDIVGSIDPLKATVDTLKRANPAVDVVAIDGADHMTTFGDPRYLAAVQEFLAAHSLKQTSAAAN